MERLALGPVFRSEVALCGRLAIAIVSYIGFYSSLLFYKLVDLVLNFWRSAGRSFDSFQDSREHLVGQL